MWYPAKLKHGDEIRVIAPSTSLSIVSKENISNAKIKLESLGYKVSFSKFAKECDIFNSSTIEQRVADLHSAFLDVNVKAILTAIGGYNSNQLLSKLDYNLIRKNPKILSGFSDITALQNAIYAKTGLVTYSGPHFSTFGMLEGLEYTVNYFKQIFTSQEPVKLAPAANWSNDTWFINQNNRTFVTNKGWDIIRRGRAAGKVIGGNLCTLNLLQGTPFMPSLCDSVLFLEDNFQSDAVEFDRNLQSLLHQQHLSGLKGLVIGRFQPESKITLEELKFIINTKDELTEVPVVTGLDFGHTTPIFTFPIGGEVEINIEPDDCRIAIIKH